MCLHIYHNHKTYIIIKMEKNFNIEVLVGEKEELYTITVSPEDHKKILNGDQQLLQQIIAKETEKRSITTIQKFFANSNENNSNQDFENLENIESIESKEIEKKGDEKQAIFNWSDKAVMLFLELYREKEYEFNAGLKRHNKLWSEIALEVQKSNYNVSDVQVQNKMSSMKRTYKKIKDSNAKSGNHNSSWMFYSIMDSLFGDKAWVSPPAIASSDGPAMPSALASSSLSSACNLSSSSTDNFESQEVFCSKKKKVETVLESFISDIQSNRDQIREERKIERLEKEKKKEQRWEMKRTEKREVHKETSEIQRSLVDLLSKLVEKQT